MKRGLPGCQMAGRFKNHQAEGEAASSRRPGATGILFFLALLAGLSNPPSWSDGPAAPSGAGGLATLPSGATSLLAPRLPGLLARPRQDAGEVDGRPPGIQAQPLQAGETRGTRKSIAATKALLDSKRRPLLQPKDNGRVTGSAARIPYLRNYSFSTGNSYKDPGRNNNTPGAVRNGYVGQSGDTSGTSGNPLFIGPPGA